MEAKIRTTTIILALFLVAITASMVLAEPYGPQSVTEEENTRGNLSHLAPIQVMAQGGNLTQLKINITEITGYWQGYYGNVSGVYTLMDASGNIMYDWSVGTGYAPAGSIFAANGTITNWEDVMCVALYGNDTSVNVTTLEEMYGMSETAGDGIDETFTETYDIAIGTNNLVGCPGTNTYVENASQTGFFNMTLLVENSTRNVLIATQIENGATGFDGRSWDFQMIVPVIKEAETTPYWFYVEIA